MQDYDPNNVIEAMEPELAKVAEKTSSVLLVPTLADILHEHEQEFVAVGIGTPGKRVWTKPTAGSNPVLSAIVHVLTHLIPTHANFLPFAF